MLTPVEIDEGLGSAGGLATANRPDRRVSARCRRRSIGATTCWRPEEQAVYRRLAVFSGAWTLEAAEAVCALGDDQSTACHRSVTLVDHSLVVRDGDRERSRSRILVPIAEDAAGRRRPQASRSAAGLAHATYYLEPDVAPAPRHSASTVPRHHDRSRSSTRMPGRDPVLREAAAKSRVQPCCASDHPPGSPRSGGSADTSAGRGSGWSPRSARVSDVTIRTGGATSRSRGIRSGCSGDDAADERADRRSRTSMRSTAPDRPANGDRRHRAHRCGPWGLPGGDGRIPPHPAARGRAASRQRPGLSGMPASAGSSSSSGDLAAAERDLEWPGTTSGGRPRGTEGRVIAYLGLIARRRGDLVRAAALLMEALGYCALRRTGRGHRRPRGGRPPGDRQRGWRRAATLLGAATGLRDATAATPNAHDRERA